MHGSLRGLNWVALIMHWRRGTGEVVDLIDLDVKRKCHIVSNQLESRVLEQMLNVGPRGGIEVIDAQHLVPSLQQSVAEVRSNEARSSRDEHPLTVKHPRPPDQSFSSRIYRRAAGGASSRAV
jgi:hypothetical protein